VKRRDRCARYCGEQIKGIVENLKRTGEVTEDFEITVRPVRGLTYVPGGSYKMTCPLHGNTFIVTGGSRDA
jgi:hypothetical protein